MAAVVADVVRPGTSWCSGRPTRSATRLVGLNTEGIRVRSNRGVAGIDGTVSTTVGAARSIRAGHALLGDLTFATGSGLLIGPTEPVPQNLTIVVSNDNGGGIFELLEQGDPRFSDVSSRIFGTPHDVDVGALCRAHHVEARQIEVGELGAALDEPHDGMRVLGGQGRPARFVSCTPRSRRRLIGAGCVPCQPPCPGATPTCRTSRSEGVARAKCAVWIVMGLVTLQSVLLVAGLAQ